jgi:hypothetical protein
VFDVQVTAATALTPVGNDFFVHVIPPSLLIHAGAAAPLRDDPLTTQLVPFEQEIALSVNDPGGVTTEAHFVPPSDVTTSNALARDSVTPSELEPMATHVVVDEHDTERRTPVPPLTNLGVHVLPPSVLTKIWAPTATQNDVAAQLTDPRAPTFAGSVGVAHVEPPSVDNRICPPYGPLFPGVTPTPTHVVELGQLTPRNVVLAVGTATDAQLDPPLFVITIAPTPAATQSAESQQLIALSSGSPEARALALQVPPPSVDTAALPRSVLSPPTATHLLVVGHVMALKPPLPSTAPPGVATFGSFV